MGGPHARPCVAERDLGNSRPMKSTGKSSEQSTVLRNRGAARPIRLKELAKRLNLSPTTISLVLNRAPAAKAIPESTKQRIFEAAEGLNYRPNLMARSLRSQRTYSIGVLVPEFSDGYSATVLSGIEEVLLREGYIYLVTTHRHKPQFIDRNSKLLYERRVEGLIAVDTPYDQHLPLPVVSVSGHKKVSGVTNIVLNHRRASEAALAHLVELGHQNIAFLQGQEFSSDTAVRWDAIRAAAKKLGIRIYSENVARLEGDSPSPEPGYEAARKVLEGGQAFTALIAFNDTSAIGTVRAFREAGLEVPRDISVIGFDDVSAAAYHNPALTTIRQPLWRMGVLAAENLLERIVAGKSSGAPETIHVEAELIVRESTAPAASSARRRQRSR